MLDLERSSSVCMVLHLVSDQVSKGRKTLDLPDNCFTTNRNRHKDLSMKTKSKRREAKVQAHLKLKEQKLLKIDDEGGLLSNLGGLPLLAKVAEDTGLVEIVSQRVPEWRNEAFITFSKGELLTQRLFLAAGGSSDAIDCSILRDDPALKSVLGKEPDGLALASQSTHTRLEQAIDEATVKELEEFFLDFYFDQHKQAPRRLAINIDGSGIRTYGAQQGATYRGGKKPQEQYFPLVATTDSGWLLLGQLRYGRVSDANALPAIKDLVLRIRSKWPNTVLTLRLDTGFNSPELLKFLDEEGIGYECGYPCTDGVRAMCGDVFAKVIDFGVAKFVRQRPNQRTITKPGQIFGTPLYMSPEQCQGKKPDHRSDIYSLGCVLYETLCGVPPLLGDSTLTTIFKHVNELPIPFSQHVKDAPIPKEIEAIVFKALAKQPENRFQSAGEMRAALELYNKQRPSGPVRIALPWEPTSSSPLLVNKILVPLLLFLLACFVIGLCLFLNMKLAH